jgi:hypothetical protein
VAVEGAMERRGSDAISDTFWEMRSVHRSKSEKCYYLDPTAAEGRTISWGPLQGICRIGPRFQEGMQSDRDA